MYYVILTVQNYLSEVINVCVIMTSLFPLYFFYGLHIFFACRLKGSDASWLNDREPPEALLDYSDDEQERNAKKKRQQAKRQGSCEAVEQEESDRGV